MQAAIYRLGIPTVAVVLIAGACGTDPTVDTAKGASVTTTTTTTGEPDSTTSTAAPTTEPSPTTEPTIASTTTSIADPALSLAGKRFVVDRAWTGDDPFPYEGKMVVQFTDTGTIVRWSGGCNTSGAEVEITESRLLVGSDAGGTAMGCAEPGPAQDAFMWKLLTSDPAWQLHENQLTLTGASRRIEATAS